MTLMHYLCKLLTEKMPELLDFDKDLTHLEAASKIQLKTLAEEMQAVSKGLEKVEQELTASDNDGYIFMGFQNVRKNEDSSLNKELIPSIFVIDLSISLFQMNSWGILLGNIACCFLSYCLVRLLWHTE